MDLLDEFIELGHSIQATGYELASLLYQALVPELQLVGTAGAVAQLPQETVSLHQHAVVLV